MKPFNPDQLEEVNLLFEMTKTMLLTGLSQTKIKRYLREYTHTEIRHGEYVNGEYIIPDLVRVQ